jgi:hypothetical protein
MGGAWAAGATRTRAPRCDQTRPGGPQVRPTRPGSAPAAVSTPARVSRRQNPCHFEPPSELLPCHAPRLWGGRVGRHREAPGPWVARGRREQPGLAHHDATSPGPAARRSAPQGRAAPRLPCHPPHGLAGGKTRATLSRLPSSRRATHPVCGADVPAATAERPADGWRVGGGSNPDWGTTMRPDPARRPAGPPHKAGQRPGCRVNPPHGLAGGKTRATLSRLPSSRRATHPVCGADVPAATAKRPADGWRVGGGSNPDSGTAMRPDPARRPAGPPHKAGQHPGCRVTPRTG